MFGLDLARFGAIIVAVLVAIDVHECCHAWVASELGDPTARSRGRVSLNPLVHLDPLGTIMIFLTAITGFGIGWGKPVPVDPYRLRYGPMKGMGSMMGMNPRKMMKKMMGGTFMKEEKAKKTEDKKAQEGGTDGK